VLCLLLSALLSSAIVMDGLTVPGVEQDAVTTESETITHYVYTTATITHSGSLNVMVGPPSRLLCGTSEYVPINGRQGDLVSVSSTVNIDLFVFPNVSLYLAWSGTHSCNFDKADGALVKQHDTRTWSFSLPVDDPVLAFLNTHAQAASVTVIQTAVETSIGLSLTTRVISSLRTIEPSLNISLNINFTSPFTLAVIALIVGALTVVAILAIPKRRDRTAAEKTYRLKSFCIKCGAEIPSGSKFCNECGAAQT
jgi:hypothetical protein